MIELRFLLAKIPAVDAPAIDPIEFVLSGLMVVVASLTCLAVMCTAIGWLIKSFAPKPAAPAAAIPTAEERPTPEELAVITAALSAVVSQPHRIVHVRGLTPDDMAWSREGRAQIHSSHALKPRDTR